MGRPSKFSKALADKICEKLSEGEPLASICRKNKAFPAVRTVSDWKRAHPEFSADFARARDEGFDAIAAETLRIADTPVKGIRTKKSKEGLEVTTEDMLGHRRLQVETRLKLLAKWDPKRYGDKIEVESGPRLTDTLSKTMKGIRARRDRPSE